jgi:hypothetical protein
MTHWGKSCDSAMACHSTVTTICEALNMMRTITPGNHPLFQEMITIDLNSIKSMMSAHAAVQEGSGDGSGCNGNQKWHRTKYDIRDAAACIVDKTKQVIPKICEDAIHLNRFRKERVFLFRRRPSLRPTLTQRVL